MKIENFIYTGLLYGGFTLARWGVVGGQGATNANTLAKIGKEKCLEHADTRILEEVEKKMKRPSDLGFLKRRFENRYDICKYEIQYFNQSNAQLSNRINALLIGMGISVFSLYQLSQHSYLDWTLSNLVGKVIDIAQIGSYTWLARWGIENMRQLSQAHEKAKAANNKCLSKGFDNSYRKAKNMKGNLLKTETIRSEVSKKCQKMMQDFGRHPKSTFHFTFAMTNLAGVISSLYRLHRRFY